MVFVEVLAVGLVDVLVAVFVEVLVVLSVVVLVAGLGLPKNHISNLNSLQNSMTRTHSATEQHIKENRPIQIRAQSSSKLNN